MAYPRPIYGESYESMYAQAIFFFDEYERINSELKKMVSGRDDEGKVSE